MGMFSSISNNALQGLNQAQALAGRPNVSIGRPGFQDFEGAQPAVDPITGMPAQTPTPAPGFQTTYQQLGYNSLEAMKDAMDPNWRNSPGQPGFGPVPNLSNMMGGAIGNTMEQQMPGMGQPFGNISQSLTNAVFNQPQQQMPMTPPGLPTGSAPGGKSAMPGDNFSPGSNFRPAPGQPPNVQIGSPGGMMPEQFTGGLRPAPSNFRPPQRSPLMRPGGIMRRRSPR